MEHYWKIYPFNSNNLGKSGDGEPVGLEVVGVWTNVVGR